VAPIAKKLAKEIQLYTPSKTFAEQLLQQKGKTILVVGHSNTIPALANALLKEQKFKDLDDSVYNKIFIVTITGDKAEVKVLEY
jgi:broad specificity phosphatase PhoE